MKSATSESLLLTFSFTVLIDLHAVYVAFISFKPSKSISLMERSSVEPCHFYIPVTALGTEIDYLWAWGNSFIIYS